jgi:hypothetical protein
MYGGKVKQHTSSIRYIESLPAAFVRDSRDRVDNF